MKNSKPDNDLSDQLKQDLKDTKTKEELDALVSSSGFELDDDNLNDVAGGLIDEHYFIDGVEY